MARMWSSVSMKSCPLTTLTKYVGDVSFAQLVHFVVVSLAWCLEGLHSLVMIFADRDMWLTSGKHL